MVALVCRVNLMGLFTFYITGVCRGNQLVHYIEEEPLVGNIQENSGNLLFTELILESQAPTDQTV